MFWRHGDTPHDVSLQHPAGLHHSPQFVAREWDTEVHQDSFAHKICSELCQEVLLGSLYFSIFIISTIHFTSCTHGFNGMWKNFRGVYKYNLTYSNNSPCILIDYSKQKNDWSNSILCWLKKVWTEKMWIAWKKKMFGNYMTQFTIL